MQRRGIAAKDGRHRAKPDRSRGSVRPGERKYAVRPLRQEMQIGAGLELSNSSSATEASWNAMPAFGTCYKTSVAALSKVIAQRHAKPWHASATMPIRRHSTLLPNASLNRTRYGRRRKPSVRCLRHCRTLGLRRPPPRAG
jgi:hypothetical protein